MSMVGLGSRRSEEVSEREGRAVYEGPHVIMWLRAQQP